MNSTNQQSAHYSCFPSSCQSLLSAPQYYAIISVSFLSMTNQVSHSYTTACKLGEKKIHEKGKLCSDWFLSMFPHMTHCIQFRRDSVSHRMQKDHNFGHSPLAWHVCRYNSSSVSWHNKMRTTQYVTNLMNIIKPTLCLLITQAEIPRLHQNLWRHYCIHYKLPLIPFLGHLNPVHNLPSYFKTI
jgi:hypothetical protein